MNEHAWKIERFDKWVDHPDWFDEGYLYRDRRNAELKAVELNARSLSTPSTYSKQ